MLSSWMESLVMATLSLQMAPLSVARRQCEQRHHDTKSNVGTADNCLPPKTITAATMASNSPSSYYVHHIKSEINTWLRWIISRRDGCGQDTIVCCQIPPAGLSLDKIEFGKKSGNCKSK